MRYINRADKVFFRMRRKLSQRLQSPGNSNTQLNVVSESPEELSKNTQVRPPNNPIDSEVKDKGMLFKKNA